MNYGRVLPSTVACRLFKFFRDRLWLRVAAVGLEVALRGPDEEGGFVRLMEEREGEE